MTTEPKDYERFISTAEIAERLGRTQRCVQKLLSKIESVHGSVRSSRRVDLQKLMAVDPWFFNKRFSLPPGADDVAARLDEHARRLGELEQFRATALDWFKRGAQ